jgi:hypothetical protein
MIRSGIITRFIMKVEGFKRLLKYSTASKELTVNRKLMKSKKTNARKADLSKVDEYIQKRIYQNNCQSMNHPGKFL